MFKFLRTTGLGLAALLAIALHANAAPFDAKAFADAQAANKTVLIDVTAPWCPVCVKQRPIIESIKKERPNLIVYEVDFDSTKDVLKRFRVSSQSTLIVFKGANEVARSTGVTDPARIRAMVLQGF
jgi:thioredoxin 1